MRTPASLDLSAEAGSPDVNKPFRLLGLRAETMMAKAPFVAVAVIAGLALIALLLIAMAESDGVPSKLLHYEAAAVMLAIMLLACMAGIIIQRALHRSAAQAAIREAEARAELTRDKEAAEAASAAKSRYLASVSHEIRSPLNSIYGYAQLLERGGEVSPGETARVIRRSAEHLTNLVEGLLDISQVEGGVLRVSHDVVRFAPFLDQIASMFRHAAASKDLRLVYDRPEMLPEFVRMDQKRVRQILINLLSNAIKFTRAGTVTFRVTYSGQTALFEVGDTGPGIAEADRERIFVPFERGAETHSQPGIGLGLAITQALVQILGGELNLESEVGKGSIFRVRMMLGQIAGKMGELSPAALITGYEGPRKSVLVVDDDMNQLTLIRSLLESLGFDVAVANSGETGLALCSARAFDLALLDISMPGISGWETARRLRESCKGSIRIIMLSGNAHEKHGDGGPIVHDMFIVKPVELSALIDAIGAQLELRWTSTAGDDADAADSRRGQGDAVPDVARPHLEKIRELLRIGHVRGIENEIKQLADVAPETDDLTARLFDYLDRFDLSGLEEALEKHL